MKRQLIILFAFFALSANANAEMNNDPFTDYLGLEIEKLELEHELFGFVSNNDAVSIESIDIYEVPEEVVLDFDTAEYLPEGFNAKEGMEDIDWNTITLYEVEEELDLGFDTKDYLPKNFNPYHGMALENFKVISYLKKNKMRY